MHTKTDREIIEVLGRIADEIDGPASAYIEAARQRWPAALDKLERLIGAVEDEIEWLNEQETAAIECGYNPNKFAERAAPLRCVLDEVKK